MRVATLSYIRRVGIEYGIVVRLPVFGKSLDDLGVRLITVSLKRTNHHPDATVRHDRALQWCVGLQAKDDFVLSINVARPMCGDRSWNLRNVQDSLPSFLNKQLVQPAPNLLRAFCRGRQEGFISFVGLVVALNEIPDV